MSEAAEIKTIVATRRADGRVTVDGFPEFVAFSTAFLKSADPKFVTTRIEIRADNGRAIYEVAQTEEVSLSLEPEYALRARLIEHEWTP